MNTYLTDAKENVKDTKVSQTQELEKANILPERFTSVSEPSVGPIVDPAYTSVSRIIAYAM